MQGRLSPQDGKKIQSFPWRSWINEFKKGRDLKFMIIEWTLDYKNLYKNPLMTQDGRKKIKFLMKKYNFIIPSLTGDCFMQRPFWKANKQERKILQNDFLNILESSSLVGIKKIVLPLVDNGRIENKKQKKILINFLKKINSFLKKKNIQILFESDFEPKTYLKFVKQFNKNFFGINYDTGNSASLGFDPEKEILTYGKLIKNIHIKDRKFKGKTVPLGFGDADFKAIFKNLYKIKYKGNYILQTARSSTHRHALALCNYKEFTKNLLNKYNNV